MSMTTSGANDRNAPANDAVAVQMHDRRRELGFARPAMEDRNVAPARDEPANHIWTEEAGSPDDSGAHPSPAFSSPDRSTDHLDRPSAQTNEPRREASSESSARRSTT